jgi:2-polyprenyl-6-methoxyphenol hydroxylase-like FAD-dependent oxidoreductase
MRIVCVGGGPAGLYFAISMKLRDAGHDITVIERDPPGATYGWGVGYWDNLLDLLYRNDRESAQQVRAASTVWQQHQVCLPGGRTAYLPGYGFSLGRAALLDVLAQRARDLGIDVQHCREVDDLSAFADADLVIATDGANSRIRALYADRFGAQVDIGGNPYIWLGADKVFDKFTFSFEHTHAGWIWFYAYPSLPGISTCVVECAEETWQGLGFDSLSSEDSIRLLEKIFDPVLDGHSLISRSRGEQARWLRFTQVRNEIWYHGNVVLAGDAAHTTHFTLGSGTSLAIIDAVVLAQRLYEHAELPAALQAYDRQRRARLRSTQAAARTSMAWFEHVDRYVDRNVVEFAYVLSARNNVQSPWQYQLHRAIQVPALRSAQRGLQSVRRWYRALRRGEMAAGSPPGLRLTRRSVSG